MSLIEEFKVIDGPLIIERATPADYRRVGDIVVDAYLHAGHFDDPEHEYLQFIRQVQPRAEAAEVYVARRDGQAIATMTLMTHGNSYADIALEGELEIRMLSVDPNIQRSGAGRAMVLAAIERAKREPGIHTVSLTTGQGWTAARKLYESLGFQRNVERDWYVPNTDILLIVYTLEVV